MIEIYSLQYENRVSVAPNDLIIGSKKISSISIKTIPIMVEQITMSVKFCLASNVFPSPNFFATMALPPVANMIATPQVSVDSGSVILIADKAACPTKRETKIPSMMV